MHTPVGAPRLSVLLLAAAVPGLFFAAGSATAQTSGAIKQTITHDLPRYDPAAYAKAQADQAARAAPKNAPGPIPEEKPAAPAAESAVTRAGVLQLPKMVVNPDKPSLPPLPRLGTPEVFRSTPGELFESPAARDARLVQRHLTVLDRVLNHFVLPLFGSSLEARARSVAAEEGRAGKLNDLASLIELDAAAGRDPEETKKLRAAFSRIYQDSR